MHLQSNFQKYKPKTTGLKTELFLCILLAFQITMPKTALPAEKTEPSITIKENPPGKNLFSKRDLVEYLQQAHRSYLNNDFDQAIEGYLKVLKGGIRHPDLYFSLANAYYLAGQKGPAVLFYEKSLAIQPSYTKAASNLAIVQKELIDRVEMPDGRQAEGSRWEMFIRNTSINRLSCVFFSLYSLMFILLILKRLRWRESVQAFLFWLNVPTFGAMLIFALLLSSRIYLEEKIHYGVVIEPATSLQEGPERFAKEKMEIHEGIKVRLLKQTGEYVRVQLANGVEGFINQNHIGKI